MLGLPTGVKFNHQELEALEEILCLRPPERRRLRKMIETRGTCAPHGQNIQEWTATATGARVAAAGAEEEAGPRHEQGPRGNPERYRAPRQQV